MREGKEGMDLLEEARGTLISTIWTQEHSQLIVSYSENMHTFESDCKDQNQTQPKLSPDEGI